MIRYFVDVGTGALMKVSTQEDDPEYVELVKSFNPNGWKRISFWQYKLIELKQKVGL